MKPVLTWLLSAVVLTALAAGGGYWFGLRGHTSTQEATLAASASGAATHPAPKLLYYRNPMGLPDTSPTPKKDSMGMDYIAVYEGDDDKATAASGAPQIAISAEKIQQLGVRTEAVTKRALGQVVRAAGRIEP